MNRRTTNKTKSRIPDFSSYEEEARFWDTHDTTDFEDEFKPVRVRVAKNLSEGLTIRLDPDTLEKVRTEAHERGIGATTLIRMWVLEHVGKRHA
jgi:predicted DNA binding CopG/RHH family protein